MKEIKKKETLTELEEYFKTKELDGLQLELNKWTLILDCKKYVDSHVDVLKIHTGNSFYMRFYKRLVELKEYLEKEK